MDEQKNSWKTFLCGKAIERCAAEVVVKNRKNLLAFSALGIVMMSFAILFAWLMRDIFTFNIEFIVMWLYFLIMYVLNKFVIRYTKYVTASFYFWIIPVMLMGVIMGTFSDPEEPSITIMVFLGVLPIFILDKPWRIVLFILASAAVYTVCCYLSKTIELFLADMIDLVLFAVLGVGVNCLTLRDRIDNVEYAMQMRLVAQTDALTELNNRGAGEEKVRLLMAQGKGGMLLLIDVDNFKSINDQYGHMNGDQVLKTIASCLSYSFRENDVIIRFGGDEFMVFALGVKNQKDGMVCIGRMMRRIHRLSLPNMSDYRLSISVGVGFFESKSEKSFEALYSEADEALYQTKRSGKDSYTFFGAAPI